MVCVPRSYRNGYQLVLYKAVGEDDAGIERVLMQKEYKKNFENKLSKEVKALNPEIKTSVIVLTDGKDNSSTRSSGELKKIMKKVQNEGTIALFLAANQDAITEGEHFGFSEDSCITYGADGEHVGSAMDAMSRICRNISDGSSAATTDYGFSEMERSISAPVVEDSVNEEIWNDILPPPPPPLQRMVRQRAETVVNNTRMVLRPNSPLDSPPDSTTPKSSHVSPLSNIKLPSYDFKEEEAIQALLKLSRR